ncbi:MAG: ketopantoate reductase C-terminal domain-containing protein [Desulfobacterales bacterium]|jgi:2-dehydropantoate 2-reductase
MAFDRAGIPHDTPEDMVRTPWWKYMINVGMNQASAVTGAPQHDVNRCIFQTSADARALMRALMNEVIALGKALEANLTASDIDDGIDILQTLSPEGKTSMLQDVEAGRQTEVAMFAGQVVALGRQHGIATPVNEALLHMIRVLEARRS